MAPATGMAGFVQGRNGDATTDLNDLKMQVPGTKSERKRKSRNNAVHRENGQPGRQGRQQGDAPTKSNNSSADNLSTTASTTRRRSGGDQRLETRSRSYDRHGTNGDQAAAFFGGTDYDEDPDADQDLPQDPLEEKFERMHAESRIANGSPTIAQTHIKGDSYPPTSAGVPSVTDHRDRNEVRASGGLQNLPTHAAERSIYGTRAPRSQLQPTTTRRQAPTAPHGPEQPSMTSHQLHDIRPIDSELTSDYGASAGFAFAPAPVIKKEVAVHAAHPLKQAVSSRPLAAGVKVDAPRPDREPNQPAVAQANSATNHQTASTERHAYQHERHPRVTEVQSYHSHQGASAGQAPMSDQGPASDALTEQDPVEHFEQQVVNEEPLDYDLQELYNKDYASLKGEPFDHSPNGQPFVVPGLSDSAVLADKLVHLSGAEPKTQVEFFESLNIDDWEEAGDWFLDRFGETIRKLKDIRREKRKAARAFEDEIEVRETAVNKKRTLTQAAMIEMKANGAAVLQGTPGKKR